MTSFEDKNPFDNGTVVEEHATEGTKALRIDKDFVSMDAGQNWTGYDYIKADVYTDAKRPLELYVEIRDRQTQDYWTRVNYTTVVPPGKSTLIIPTALYVGEKARPGRALLAERHHPAGLLHRREAGGAVIHRQYPPGARQRDRQDGL